MKQKFFILALLLPMILIFLTTGYCGLQERVNVLVSSGRYKEALKAVNAELHLDSNNVQLIEMKVKVLADMGKNEDAINEYRKVFRLTNKHNQELLRKIAFCSIGDKSALMRAGGAIAVGQLGNTGAMPLLRRNLADKSFIVRIWTAISISETGDKKAVPGLVRLLRDRVDFVRISALVSLGKLGNPGIVPEVARALKDKNPNVRQMAAITLGKIGGKRAIPYLERTLMEDNDAWAKLAAVASLEKLMRNK